MLAEIKQIHRTAVHTKSVNQLKGGSSPKHEFFCTYTSFNIKNIQIYSDEALEAPELVEDHPINLRDPELMKKNPRALPHMRFLLNNSDLL